MGVLSKLRLLRLRFCGAEYELPKPKLTNPRMTDQEVSWLATRPGKTRIVRYSGRYNAVQDFPRVPLLIEFVADAFGNIFPGDED